MSNSFGMNNIYFLHSGDVTPGIRITFDSTAERDQFLSNYLKLELNKEGETLWWEKLYFNTSDYGIEAMYTNQVHISIPDGELDDIITYGWEGADFDIKFYQSASQSNYYNQFDIGSRYSFLQYGHRCVRDDVAASNPVNQNYGHSRAWLQSDGFSEPGHKMLFGSEKQRQQFQDRLLSFTVSDTAGNVVDSYSKSEVTVTGTSNFLVLAMPSPRNSDWVNYLYNTSNTSTFNYTLNEPE